MESANVVGYNTVTIKPGYNMFSVNFKNVGNNDGVCIQDLFPGGGKKDTIFKAGSGEAKADYIKVWNNAQGEYATYFLYIPAKNIDTNKKSYYWTDSSLNITSNRFTNGSAFWFYSRNTEDVTATTSGEVELTEIKTVNINPGYNMIGSYFPTGWVLNDEYYSPTYWKNSEAIAGSGEAKADYLKVWNAAQNEYSTYFLYIPAKNIDTNKKSYHWVDSSLNIISNSVMGAGQGAWYYHRGSGFNLEIKKQF